MKLNKLKYKEKFNEILYYYILIIYRIYNYYVYTIYKHTFVINCSINLYVLEY